MSVPEFTGVENTLQASEERYRSLVLAISDFVWIADPTGNFIAPQDSWMNYTGQNWDQHQGLRWLDAVHPDDRERVAHAWQNASRERCLYEVEWRCWHAQSGQHRHCLTRAVAISNGDGTVREWIGSVSDIHARKCLEEQLRHRDKVESLGVLAGGIAHDFNNLLVGILGNASLAAEDATPENRELLEDIARSAERAADLTRQLLAYAGKGELSLKPVDLTAEVQTTLRMIRSSLHAHATLALELEERLPAVEADPSQMQQLVMNLAINASEALPEKGGTVTIRTGTEQLGLEAAQTLYPGYNLIPGVYVYLSVEDSGAGMLPETRARIFDPFFTTKFTGRGLGLAVVLGVVKAHRGAITVESRRGVGTTFRAIIPAMARTAAVRSGRPQNDPGSVPVTGTVLIIDDEEVVRKLVTASLSRNGMRVLKATDGESGIEVFREHVREVDAVILDVSMPGLSSEETLARLREIRTDVPVLISSGHPAVEVRRRFPDVAGYLAKPYQAGALAETVGRTIRERGRAFAE